jgi:hypothetical protein
MKKIIAISVMFALVAGAAFAADVSGSVIATIAPLNSDNSDGSVVWAGGGWNRLRIEAAGDSDGMWGGWFRLDGRHWSGDPVMEGYGWWKPMDEFKLIIGEFSDGMWGKEGVSGWMFYQTATDTGVSMGGDNVWNGSFYGYGFTTRDAFFGGGATDPGAFMEIKPAEIVDINIHIPFIAAAGAETADVFKKMIAQLSFNLDFGNVALTYRGDVMEADAQPTIYAYFGGNFDALSIDFSLAYKMPLDMGGTSVANPIFIGLGVKYATDEFGVKARVIAGLAGDDKNTYILFDALPFYVMSDTMRAFVGFGIGMIMPDQGDSMMDWHFNPYLEVGGEWGPKFLAGIKVWSGSNGDVVNWAVPLAFHIGF